MSQDGIQIARSASVISIATMLSRILGLIREQMIAVLFSRTATDAFYVAFRIPNLLRDLFAEGAMSAAFVPTFTDYLKRRGLKEAWQLASGVFTLLAVVLSAITILGILFSKWIVARFAADFQSVPGKYELTVFLTQIMFPFLPMVALAAVAMGILNSQGSFFLPAFSSALFNVGSITVGLILYYWLTQAGSDPILGMAIGTLVGGCLQFLVQVPSLRKKGFVYTPSISFAHPGVRRILLLMGPGTVGLASTQINIFVNTWLATTQGEGPVSWLNYAFRLMQFPIGLFGVAIATAALPTVSARVVSQENLELRKTLSSALKMVFVINVPASIGLMVLSHPIIALIYQHGRFKEIDTISTSNALILYSIGLFSYSAVKVLVPAFYALGHSGVPVAISFVVVGLNIGMNLALIGPMGYLGLALGTSFAAIVNFALLLFWLQRYCGPLDTTSIFQTLAKIAFASAVMGAGCYRFHLWLFDLRAAEVTLAWRAFALAASISMGIAVLVVVGRLLGIPELDAALRLVKNKVRNKWKG
jgi:putative peptidoglycan lipid II flippase